ncbi:hypothetical protein N9D31_01100 [Oligoflexaceae bacterium]|nr:hypothetical protein [Oligoflexaceae bacterium]
MQKICLSILVILSSCTYRFTNRHIKRPADIKTIGIESVYDTSSVVLPHEILWQELQSAFAADGKLKLVPVSAADAVVRAHIQTAGFLPGRIERIDEAILDPDVNDPTETAKGDDYTNFRKLTQAGEYTLEDYIKFGTRIEVVDMRNRNVLLNKVYSGRRQLKTSRGGNDAGSFFLIYQEAKQNRFRQISKQIAKKVVEDLLISY